jgi:hypothetical protein
LSAFSVSIWAMSTDTSAESSGRRSGGRRSSGTRTRARPGPCAPYCQASRRLGSLCPSIASACPPPSQHPYGVISPLWLTKA